MPLALRLTWTPAPIPAATPLSCPPSPPLALPATLLKLPGGKGQASSHEPQAPEASPSLAVRTQPQPACRLCRLGRFQAHSWAWAPAQDPPPSLHPPSFSQQDAAPCPRHPPTLDWAWHAPQFAPKAGVPHPLLARALSPGPAPAHPVPRPREHLGSWGKGKEEPCPQPSLWAWRPEAGSPWAWDPRVTRTQAPREACGAGRGAAVKTGSQNGLTLPTRGIFL